MGSDGAYEVIVGECNGRSCHANLAKPTEWPNAPQGGGTIASNMNWADVDIIAGSVAPLHHDGPVVVAASFSAGTDRLPMVSKPNLSDRDGFW